MVESGHATADLEARVVVVDQEHRWASRCGSNDDDEICAVSSGGEVLVACDDPPGIGLPRCGLEHRWVRSGPRSRLCHSDRRSSVAGREWREVALFLFGRAGISQQVDVPVVRCGTVHGEGAEEACACGLEDECLRPHVESESTVSSFGQGAENSRSLGFALQVESQGIVHDPSVDDNLPFNRDYMFGNERRGLGGQVSGRGTVDAGCGFGFWEFVSGYCSALESAHGPESRWACPRGLP